MSSTTNFRDQNILEKKSRDDGFTRYIDRKHKLKSKSSRKPEADIITEANPKVAIGIEESINYQKTKGRGTKPLWLDVFLKLKSEDLAHIGLSQTMDAVASIASRPSLFIIIGRRVEIQVWADGLKDFDSKAHNRIEQKSALKHNNFSQRVRDAIYQAQQLGYTTANWSKEKQLKIGAELYSQVMQHSEIFLEVDLGANLKTDFRITLTEKAKNELDKADKLAAWASPIFAPMVEKPKPWKSFNTGCYHLPELAALVPLVRQCAPDARRIINYQFEEGIPKYAEAVNILQETKFKINTHILKAVEWAYKSGKIINKFPLNEPLKKMKELRTLPDLDKMTQDQKSIYISQKRDADKSDLEISSSSTNYKQDISTARSMSTFDDGFYLPWNMDNRGRCYHVSNFSYMRADYVKAMFLFHNGSRLTQDDNSLFWLKVHTANVCDFDGISKGSLDERVEWFDKNLEMIIAVGTDFKATFDIWSKADKPFLFLAAAHAYSEFDKDRENYICHIPVQLDGTNSGAQHYGAASLDDKESDLVNLIPRDRPQDLYKVVADMANKEIQKDLKSKRKFSPKFTLTIGEMARRWEKYGVGRSECKRNTMCVLYSSKVYGLTDQLMQDFMEPLQKQVKLNQLKSHPFGKTRSEQKQCANYLARINYKSITATVKSATRGMEFIQNLCEILGKENKHYQFINRVDFPFVQNYRKYNSKKIQLYLTDKISHVNGIKVYKRKKTVSTIVVPTSKVNVRKSIASSAPNTIHSMDSSHLLSTVLLARKYGVQDFFFIHDAFGTIPSQMEPLWISIREAFVNQYDPKTDYCLYSDLLSQTADRLKNPADDRLKPIPPKGTLDILGVLESDYCFS